MAKQPYYEKRVEIFERYYQREQEKIEKAKADNKQIQVLAPLQWPSLPPDDQELSLCFAAYSQ